MSIAFLKKEMLLTEREILIGKSLHIQDRLALIVSVTEQNEEIKLWVFHHQSGVEPRAHRLSEYATNRDEIMDRIADNRLPFPHIEAISIQGQALALVGSSIGSIGHNPTSYMKLQHFVEAGADLTAIEEIDLDELALGEYKLSANSPFPGIDQKKEMPITLRTAEIHQEALVEPSHCFSLTLGEQPVDARHSFSDPVDGNEIVFYLNRLTRYDLWAEQDGQMRDGSLRKAWIDSGLSEEQIAEMLSTHQKTLEKICPRDHDLLLLQYETEQDVQLCFHTAEFLDSRPKTNQGSSVGLIFSSDSKDSVHGRRCRTCELGAVPKDFGGVTNVELISWYRKIPCEQIEI